jgi:hypothetical protein
MRNSLLAAMLIASGTTVAMPAMAAANIERYAFQQPHMQKGDTLALLGSHQASTPVITGNNVTTGIARTTKEAAPSEPSGQYQKLMNAVEGVTTGSTVGINKPAPSETDGALAAKDRLMMDSTAGTGPG